MRKILKTTLLCVALQAGGAFAVDGDTECAKQAAMAGMRARLELMHEQMSRIEWTTDRVERSQLLDLHSKHMGEGLREVRRRNLDATCRMEMMGAIMEEMVRHQLAASERDDR